MDENEKLKFAILEIQHSIIDAIPPEQNVAMRLWLYGVTEQEFSSMKRHLPIPMPTIVKIENYLRDEWKNRDRRSF